MEIIFKTHNTTRNPTLQMQLPLGGYTDTLHPCAASAALPNHAKVITYPGGRKGQLSTRFGGGQRDHGHSGAPQATRGIAAG